MTEKSQKLSLNLLNSVFWVFCSLKSAMLIILSLAASLAVGTVLESLYDTKTAQYWVYQASWFYGLLGLLGLNIFCVALSRWPWKKKHTAFLLAHLGILILLAGSWITQRIGLDGNLVVSEGESGSVVEMENSIFVFTDLKNVEGMKIRTVPIPWQPPGVKFKAIDTRRFGMTQRLTIDQFISHAEPVYSFAPAPEPRISVDSAKFTERAIRLKVEGGPMAISQEYWLWEGSPNWQTIQAGPARLSLGGLEKDMPSGRPWLILKFSDRHQLSYIACGADGKILKGELAFKQIPGYVLSPPWKGNVKITFEEMIPAARLVTTYQPSSIESGSQAPTSALHLVTGNPEGGPTGLADVWLGLGDRAVIHLGDQEFEVGYYPKRLMLPFAIRLERFTVEHDQGTSTPAAYSSRVTVVDGSYEKEHVISMNHPLDYKGYTIYQASYEEGEPRPVTSVFSVNRDPGRRWKYIGSLLLVAGSVLLFAAKYGKRKRKPNESILTRGTPILDSLSEI